MIELRSINQQYGGSQILWDIDLLLAAGSCTCLLGRNGVGKTTLLKCLMGLLPVKSGSIQVERQDITTAHAEIRPRMGIAYVPQGRDIFPQLTVEENLRTGLAGRADGSKGLPELIFELFPVLDSMMERRGGDLSGGQQQQLAIGRALVIEPRLLILDEPNEGIQPNIVEQIGDVIVRLNKDFGTTVLLVEQKLAFARRVCEDFHIMEKGRLVASGSMPELTDELVNAHLAV